VFQLFKSNLVSYAKLLYLKQFLRKYLNFEQQFIQSEIVLDHHEPRLNLYYSFQCRPPDTKFHRNLLCSFKHGT
jgi:hypothetical protein